MGIPTRPWYTCLQGNRTRRRFILYVGRNPGFREDQEGTNFVGPSGDVLRNTIIPGINAHHYADLYLTNAVRCFTVGNEPPRARHYTSCLTEHLKTDLWSLCQSYEAYTNIIVLLGGDAVSHFFRTFLGRRAMTLTKAFAINGDLHTWSFPSEADPDHTFSFQFHVFAMYHPAFLLRQPNAIHAAHSHNQLLLDCLTGVMASPTSPTMVEPRLPVPPT